MEEEQERPEVEVLQELEFNDEEEEDEEEDLENSLRQVVQDASVRPRLQCLMVDSSFSMVTLQSEDSGIMWETTSSRCSTPWASDSSCTSEIYSTEAAAGNVTIVFDQDEINRRRSRAARRSGRLGDRLSRPGSSRSASALGKERPEMMEVSVPNVKQQDGSSTGDRDWEHLRSQDQQLFSLISEGYEILNITVPAKLPTVDEEESTDLQDNLSYLSTTPRIKSRSHTHTTGHGHTEPVAQETLELQQVPLKAEVETKAELIDRGSVKDVGLDVDYFEKFTLLDETVPGEQAHENQENFQKLEEKSPREEAAEKTTVTSDHSHGPKEPLEVAPDVELVEEHLDEVFYGEVPPTDPHQQEVVEGEPRVRTRRESERSSKENGSVLFGSEETILTPIFISPGPPKIIDPILLEEPTAMSFMYSDLYEDAVGDRRRMDEGERSEAESMASECFYERRFSDTEETEGYLEKFTLKDETFSVEEPPLVEDDGKGMRRMWPGNIFGMTGCLTRVDHEDRTQESNIELHQDFSDEGKESVGLPGVSGGARQELTGTEEREEDLREELTPEISEEVHVATRPQSPGPLRSSEEASVLASDEKMKCEKLAGASSPNQIHAATEGRPKDAAPVEVLSDCGGAVHTMAKAAETSGGGQKTQIQQQLDLQEVKREETTTEMFAEGHSPSHLLKATKVVPEGAGPVEVLTDCEGAVHTVVEVTETSRNGEGIQTQVEIDLQEPKGWEITAEKFPSAVDEDGGEVVTDVGQENHQKRGAQAQQNLSGDETVKAEVTTEGSVSSVQDDGFVFLVPTGQAVEMDIEVDTTISQPGTSLTELQAGKEQSKVFPQVTGDDGVEATQGGEIIPTEDEDTQVPSLRSFSPVEDSSELRKDQVQTAEDGAETRREEPKEASKEDREVTINEELKKEVKQEQRGDQEASMAEEQKEVPKEEPQEELNEELKQELWKDREDLIAEERMEQPRLERKEDLKDVPKEELKEVPKEEPNDILKKEPKEIPKEEPKEEFKELPKEEPKEIPREEPKEEPEEELKEISKEEPEEEPKVIPKEEPEEEPKEIAKKEPEEELKEIPKKEPEEEPKEIPKEEPEEEPKEIPKEEPEEELKEIPKEEPEEELKEIPKKEPEEEPKVIPKEEPKVIPKEEPKVIPKEEPEEELKEIPKEEPEEELKEIPKEEPEEELKEIPKKEPEEEPKVIPKEEPKVIPKEEPKVIPKEEPEEEPKEIPKEEPEEEPKEIPKEEPKKALKEEFTEEPKKHTHSLLQCPISSEELLDAPASQSQLHKKELGEKEEKEEEEEEEEEERRSSEGGVSEQDYELITEEEVEAQRKAEEPERHWTLPEEEVQVLVEMERDEQEEDIMEEELEANYDIIDEEEEKEARLASELQGMDWFCVSCGTLLSDDQSVQHLTHHMTSIDQSYEELKETLSHWISALQERTENIEDLVSELELAYNSVEDQCVEREVSMQAQNEETTALVMEQYNSMSVSQEEEKKAKLEQLYDQIVSFQENIDSARGTLENTAREEETDARPPEDIQQRLRAALDKASSLDLGPKGLLVFQDYAKAKSSTSNLTQRKGIPVPQRPTLQLQEPGSACSCSVSVYWEVNPGDVIDCFQVYCMEEPRGGECHNVTEEYRVTVKESHCVLEELQPQTTYRVWVMAVNYSGCSAPSERLLFLTAPSIPNIWPERCTVLWDTATLRWSPAESGGGGTLSYTLEYCRQYEQEGEGLRSISGIRGCEQEVLLQPNDSFLFYIRAVNEAGASEQSEAALISTRGTRFHLLPESVGSAVELSENRSSLHYSQENHRAPSSPERCVFSLGDPLPSGGLYYWETVVSRCAAYRVGVAYSSANRRSSLGENSLSWCLQCVPSPLGCSFHLVHGDVQCSVFMMVTPERVGTFLDHRRGRLTFYDACNGHVIGGFRHAFSQPCHAALELDLPGSLELSMTLEAPEFTANS